MTNGVELIKDQLNRAIHGEAWHGPALDEVLAGIEASKAAVRPIAGAHTIWEIVLHLDAWNQAIVRRLGGEALEPEGSEDWPPVSDHSENAWGATRAKLKASSTRLEQAVASLDEAALDAPVAARDYSQGFQLHGAIQHILYHAGQIGLLSKAG